MRIDYVVTVNIKGNSGKEKATREKYLELTKISDCKFYSLKEKRKNTILSLIDMIVLELKYLLETTFSKSKPEIIFTRSSICFGTYLISKLFRIKLIREVHADFKDESKTLFKNKFKYQLALLFHSYLMGFYRNASGLIFNNKLLEKHYNLVYSINTNNTTTITNGCNTKEFYPINTIQAINAEGLDENYKYFIFVGSISKWHGIEYILDLFNELLKIRNDVKLLIAGGTNNSYTIKIKEKYSSENILFFENINIEKANRLINCADLCFLPVKNIRISPGSPLKLYDYISCGKPILTQSDTIGYSDIVEKYQLGMSCDLTNPIESAEIISKFVENVDLNFYLANNRKVAEENLHWRNVINKWIEFAEQLESQ